MLVSVVPYIEYGSEKTERSTLHIYCSACTIDALIVHVGMFIRPDAPIITVITKAVCMPTVNVNVRFILLLSYIHGLYSSVNSMDTFNITLHTT